MTDRAQFEAMLEALINEDQETAKEIFHNIVVGKSREIYEELLAEDFDLEESDKDDEDKENIQSEMFGDEEDSDAGSDDSDSEEDDAESDDAEMDFGGDEEGEEGEGDIEDRVLDLEDALDELKAEFEQLMAGEEGEGEHGDMFGGDEMGAELGGDEFGAEQEVDEFAGLMEYKNKVAPPKHGDNGVNTKSIVAKKNDMGGTTANIVKGGESTTGGTKGGLLAPNTKEENFGNVNVPGGKGATKLSPVKGGHGAEKKGTAPDQDKSAGSPLNGVKSRAK